MGRPAGRHEQVPRADRRAGFLLSVAIIVLGAAGCRGDTPPGVQRTVTIYVSTDRAFSEPVLREYERRTSARIDARMGLNTWAAFAGADTDAVVAGDVAMLAS